MDYDYYSIYYCGEIHYLEDTPTGFHFSNNNSNEYRDQNFLSFDFYFSKKLINNYEPSRL